MRRLLLFLAYAAATDVFLASDRTFAPVATLNSVCDNAAPASLRLHVVAATLEDARLLADATVNACGAHDFVLMGLPEIESLVREELGVDAMWTTALARVKRRGLSLIHI